MTPNFKSLHYYLRNTAGHIKKPDDIYLLEKRNDFPYHGVTYREILSQANAVSAYLLDLGVKKQDNVALILENSPAYIAFDQGLMQLGLVNVSIYPTLSGAEISHIINDSGASIILVGTPFLLKKILKIKDSCPLLKHLIIAYEIDNLPANAITWQEMLKKGEALYPGSKDAIEKVLESVERSDLACLLYTSGTTGNPKGAMLTHHNFISNVEMAVDLMPIVNKDYRFLSFLPLCHVYERTETYYLSTIVGTQIAFAQSLEALSSNIIEAKPTAILTVPRLLERIEERVRKNVSNKGGFSLKIFNWSFKAGEQSRLNRENDRKNSLLLNLKLLVAERLVFSKIKARLGGNMRIMISGGGAMPRHVGEFFSNMDVTVCEGYGLTETSPLVSVNEPHRQVFGTVGRIGKACEVAIQDPDTRQIHTVQTWQSFDPVFESAEGEILVRGDNVMKGYWNLPEETAHAIDKDGWLHTGDIGKFYKGYLKITDRIKNILVNSFGKNIYPTPIENTYLKSRRIEQIFLVGDQQEYLTAIVVPSKEEMKEHFGWEESYFLEADPFIRDAKVKSWLDEDMHRLANELGKFERVRNYIIKRTPFSLEEGELTPTQKAKRRVIEKKYEEEIRHMYVNLVE